MTFETFTKFYLLGNEDAQASADDGLYQLADKRAVPRNTLEFDAYVAGGAAFRFNGHTFNTKSDAIAA